MYDGSALVEVLVEVLVDIVAVPDDGDVLVEVLVRVAVPPGFDRVPCATTEPAYPPSPSIGIWPGANVASYGALMGHAEIVSDVVVDGYTLHPTLSEHVVL
jgi:hypothetical protein